MLIQLAVVPETAFRYSLGNVLNVPDFLKSSNNPYMASLVYKNNFDPTSASPPPPSPASSSSSWQPALPVTDLVSINRAMYGTPYHAVEMIDVVLDSTKPSEWTNVHHDDKLLRELLRAYFIYEYPFFPFLHKDYFLQDMTSGRHRFCTPLLVNAILAAGCVSPDYLGIVEIYNMCTHANQEPLSPFSLNSMATVSSTNAPSTGTLNLWFIGLSQRPGVSGN